MDNIFLLINKFKLALMSMAHTIVANMILARTNMAQIRRSNCNCKLYFFFG